MRYLVATAFFLLVLGAALYQLATVPPNKTTKPLADLLFGGVLSSEVAVDTTVETANTGTQISSPGIVWVSDTNGYIFYEDSGGGLSMSSTTNSGSTWSTPRNVDSVNTADVVSYGVWWEGWTPGTTTTRYIHIVTTDVGIDDTYYTRLDTQTGAFSTTVLGTTQGAACVEGTGCYVSITMSATGTLMMTASQLSDSWVVRCGRYLACSTASNWHQTFATGTVPPYINGGAVFADNHSPILLPVPGTDNIMLLYYSGTGASVFQNMYSGTSSTWWSTVSAENVGIGTSIELNTTYDTQVLGATLSTTTGLLFLTFADDANDYTTADHDIIVRSFSTTTWSWTTKTNCTTNYTGGVIGAKVSYDALSNTLYCIMGLRSTIGNSLTGGIYYKTSTDGGTTWSATSSRVNDNADDINGLTTNITSYDRIGVTWNYTTAPRADQQFYDDIADLFEPGGGGSTGTSSPPMIIWYD
jgi:hypothetical protein